MNNNLSRKEEHYEYFKKNTRCPYCSGELEYEASEEKIKQCSECGGLCIGMIGIIIGNVLTVIIRLILEKKIMIAF